MKHPLFVIDFDSTFTQVEALDLLGELSLCDHPQQAQRIQEIIDISALGMSGGTSFAQSLTDRIRLLEAKRKHLTPLIDGLQNAVSKSVLRNRDFFRDFADRIFIVSGGFKEFIVPVVEAFGIRPDHVYANTFRFDASGAIIGVDSTNPLSSDGGKVTLLRQLDLNGDVYVIGDGYTDYEIRQAGLAKRFYAFTENVARPEVIARADRILTSFDDLIRELNLAVPIKPAALQPTPLNVLLLENIHSQAAAAFKNAGYCVETVASALSEEELLEKIQHVQVLGIRSKTQLTARLFERAEKLLAVGAFCIGTNQIDLQAALRQGVPVFNAPYSNTRSVVELAIGELIMLLRNLPDKFRAMQNGGWDKSAKNSFEIRRKKLGIVGYGNIGTQLSIVAEALGLEVYFYDLADKMPIGNATKCLSLTELLETVQIVSLHVDGRPSNRLFFGADEFDAMQSGSYFLNLSRGPVVDISALAENLKSGKILGAGVDVFPEEPKTNQEAFRSELMGCPNVLLTPHIGGSTVEAQEHIGGFVPDKIMDYLQAGNSSGSTNFPNLQLPAQKNAHRLVHLHRNVPGMLAQINQLLAHHQGNILGQYLKTSEDIGYVITDIQQVYHADLLDELSRIPDTIRFRVLY